MISLKHPTIIEKCPIIRLLARIAFDFLKFLSFVI